MSFIYALIWGAIFVTLGSYLTNLDSIVLSILGYFFYIMAGLCVMMIINFISSIRRY